MAAALCYSLMLITGIVFLVIEPYNKNPNIRFHAFQAIFISVVLIILRIGLAILTGLFASMGVWSLFLVIWPLFGLACLLLWIYMVVMAYQGKKIVLPVIGPLAEQQAYGSR